MESMTINGELATTFRLVGEPVEVRDCNGDLIGEFRPATEIERRCNRIGVHSTQEVFEHLRRLTNDPELLADLDHHIEEIKRRSQDACPTS